MVLNTDGAAQGNPGPAGAGGVLRDDKGAWVIGFLENAGHCSSVKAEIRAVLRGLLVARETRALRVWIQLDSKVVVDMLGMQREWHPKLRGLLRQCKQLLDWEGWEVKISHCYREANQVADILAKLGSEDSVGVQLYSHPPVSTRSALYADVVGALWPRKI